MVSNSILSGNDLYDPNSSEWKNRFESQRKILPEGLMEVLVNSTVYLAGTGAFGGPATVALAKTGIKKFIISDIQSYELDNIVGQMLATTKTIGKKKTEVAKNIIHDINPEAEVEIVESSLDVNLIKDTVAHCDIVIMGMDTLSEGIACYRAARLAKKPVVDFLFFTCPNVISTFPTDPIPEERFDYSTIKLEPYECNDLSIAKDSICRLMAYSYAALPKVFESSMDMHPQLIPALINLEYPIPTFAPMTCEIGVMLAREAIGCIALENKINFPRVGWPAYYVDIFHGRSIKPNSPFLKEMPNWENWIDKLKKMQN